MTDLWTTLLPLVIGSAVLPVQIGITVLLLRADGGRATAAAWVAGMTVVRLAQGVVFGLVLETAGQADGGDDARPIVNTLLLLVAVLFLVSAGRKLLDEPDDDAPPPRWMSALASVRPGRAFMFGAGVVGLSPKLWVFTLGAIAAIGEASTSTTQGAVLFLVFVAAAESVHLAALGLAVLAPSRAEAVLGRLADALERYSRALMIGLGLVFGVWFLVKALTGFGVL